MQIVSARRFTPNDGARHGQVDKKVARWADGCTGTCFGATAASITIALTPGHANANINTINTFTRIHPSTEI